MPGLLEGKIAIITGSGRGIGRATAERFATEGARVLAADVDDGPVHEAVDAIAAGGGKAHALVGDVTARAFPEQLIETTLKLFGGLDILVNNAGFTWDGTIHKMTDEQWQAIIDVHLTAPSRIVRAAAPLLRETAKREIDTQGVARARKIVNVSSTSATRGNFGQTNYAAAKAGVIGFTKALAREWGHIETRLTAAKETGEKIRRGEMQIQLGVPAGMRDASLKLIPMGRPGTPQEAAGAILFLASPLSDYVSGQVLEVTGGL
jgi:3-oxoacyl-[acyl-carrier protein] reductase